MAKSIADKFGKGLQPQAFIDGMTKNQDKFLEWHGAFSWANDEDRDYFESLANRDDLRCLILAADWCGDVIRNVPVVLRALENSGVPVEILIKEEHMDTMGQFLTLGGEAIPIVIFADTGGFVLGHWGPRPKHVQEAMIRFKQNNPDREAPDYQDNLKAARAEMAERYGEGTGYHQAIVSELRELISSF